MRYGAVSDIGRTRRINEDNYHVEEGTDFPYVVVADGMGGHQAGEVASLMVVDIIGNHLVKYLRTDMDYVEVSEVIRRSFLSANSIIFNYARNHYQGMGTTATLAMVYQEKIITAHVGDSRAYAIDDYKIRQLTRDHSYVQELVAMGRLTPQEAKVSPKKNFITRAMGAEESVRVDIGIEPYSGERLLLCSDGLTNLVEDDEIYNYINYSPDLQSAVRGLIQLANYRGGNDNITAAVIGR